MAARWFRVTDFPSGAGPAIDWNTTYFDRGFINYNRTFFAWTTVLLPLMAIPWELTNNRNMGPCFLGTTDQEPHFARPSLRVFPHSLRGCS